MTSLPEEARAKVLLDEAAVARGIVDSSSVYVEIERPPKEIPPILAQLEELPPHEALKDLPSDVPRQLAYLEAADGRLFILTEAMLDKLRKLRRANGTSSYEMARQDPEEVLIPALSPALVAAQEYAERLCREHRSDFDSHSAATRATWIIETIKRVNKVRESIEDLGRYLAWTAPGKTKAKLPLEDALRDVRAAILKDVHEMEPEEIRTKLGMEPVSEKCSDRTGLSPAAWTKIKGEDQTVRKIADRGREVLVRAFGEEGWRTKAERMRRMREREKPHQSRA